MTASEKPLQGKPGRLNARTVASAKGPAMLADGAGLYLRVNALGSKSWVIVYRRGDKRTELGLGSAQDIGLADARQRAGEIRKMLAAGKDPKHERTVEATRIPTFGEFADAVIDSREHGWRNEKHRAQWRSTLATHAADLKNLPVDKVTTEHVLAVLQPIWTTIPETASRLRGRIETILHAAKARKFRSGENPAQWRGHLDHLLPARQKLTRGHHAALPWQDIPEFISLLRQREGVAARALEFAILTAARSGEVRGALWDEIDLEAKVWTVPASRMKAGRLHRVPLCDRAVEILREVAPIRRSDDLLFPGTGAGSPLSDMTLAAVLRRMKRDDITVHGFRSTFRDWASEQTSFPGEVVEMALAHTIRNAVEAAYRRGDLLDRRRELMSAWATYCEPSKAANVVSLSNVKRAG